MKKYLCLFVSLLSLSFFAYCEEIPTLRVVRGDNITDIKVADVGKIIFRTDEIFFKMKNQDVVVYQIDEISEVIFLGMPSGHTRIAVANTDNVNDITPKKLIQNGKILIDTHNALYDINGNLIKVNN